MANRFYVGSGSDWDTDANWSTTSGGGGGASFPILGDKALFDASSGSCTLDVNAECDDIDFTGFTATFNDGGFTLQITSPVSTGSAITFVTGMTLTATGLFIIDVTNENVNWRPAGLTFNNVKIQSSKASGITTLDIRTPGGPPLLIVSGTLDVDMTGAGTLNFRADTNNGDFTIDGNFTFSNPSGTLNFFPGTGVWTLDFSLDLTGATLTPSTGKFKFVRQGSNQNITSSGQKFNEVETTNPLALQLLDLFKAAKLIANASDSPVITFEESLTHEIDTLDLTGTGSNRIILQSGLGGTQWRLLVLGNQAADHVKVKDSDASLSANPIDARVASDDDGNNLNWTFALVDVQQILYDYSEPTRKITRILYDYIKFVPDNLRVIFNPYSQDSVRIDWSEFVPPAGYTGTVFYSIYIDGEPYAVDIDGSQTWMDLVGLVNKEDIIIDVLIQTRFGERFTFDISDLGDRIKVLFTESGDPNIARYVIFRDDGSGNIDFTKEFGEIIIKDRLDILNTDFVPESS